MKAILEEIWQDTKCRCPSHIVLWNSNHGYQEAPKLFYAKGKMLSPKQKRYRKTWLCKNYGIEWIMRNSLVLNNKL